MQKKVIFAAICLLAVALLAVACDKKDNKDEPDPSYSPVEYTIGEDGEKYITNVYGDLIPVTTSNTGAVELMEDLVTKTKEQAEKEKAEAEAGKNQTPEEPVGENNNNNNNGGNNGNNNNGNEGNNNSGGGIKVGQEDVKNNDDRDAVIVW